VGSVLTRTRFDLGVWKKEREKMENRKGGAIGIIYEKIWKPELWVFIGIQEEHYTGTVEWGVALLHSFHLDW
jgi:hypothetical protein